MDKIQLTHFKLILLRYKQIYIYFIEAHVLYMISKIAELFGGLAFIAKFLRLESWLLFWQSFHPPFLIGAIQHAKKRPKLHFNETQIFGDIFT